MNPQLVWKSHKLPSRYVKVYVRPPIDVIARAVCRREIEEARKRVVVRGRKYSFIPSEQWKRINFLIGLTHYV